MRGQNTEPELSKVNATLAEKTYQVWYRSTYIIIRFPTLMPRTFSRQSSKHVFSFFELSGSATRKDSQGHHEQHKKKLTVVH